MNFSGLSFSLTRARDRSCVLLDFSVERGKINFSRLLQVNSGLPKHQLMNIFFILFLSPSLACFAMCAERDGTGTALLTQWYFRDFSPAFLQLANISNIRLFVCLRKSREQLYHFNSPQCVKVSSSSFSLR